MELSIIQIGNSKGFRLSKTLIAKYNIKDKVELILEKGYFILKPISQPRKDWDIAFKEMGETKTTSFYLTMFLKMKTWKNGFKTVSNSSRQSRPNNRK